MEELTGWCCDVGRRNIIMDCVKPIFPLGRVLVTYSINMASDSDANFRKELWVILNQYRSFDFGLSKEDIAENLKSLRNRDGRVVARYETSHGEIFVITNFDDENGDITTVMFTREYQDRRN